MERALSDSLATEMTRLKARDRDAFDQTQKDEGDTVAVWLPKWKGIIRLWEVPGLDTSTARLLAVVAILNLVRETVQATKTGFSTAGIMNPRRKWRWSSTRVTEL